MNGGMAITLGYKNITQLYFSKKSKVDCNCEGDRETKTVRADYRIKIKENEKRDKYLVFAREF